DITQLPEYYPTRTELGILRANARQLAELAPKDAALIEFGAGSAVKAKILLNAAPQIGAYVPVDISAEFLADEARRLERDVPRVAVFPVAADFTTAFALPPPRRPLAHDSVRTARPGAPPAVHWLLPRLDHREFRAAAGQGVPAPGRPYPGARPDFHCTRRSCAR